MAAPHNIFSNTTLGGILSYQKLPDAVTSPVFLLGVPNAEPSVVGRVSDVALKALLNQSGAQNYLAMFDGSNSLMSSPLVRQGNNPYTVYADCSVKIKTDLILDARSSPGTTVANLQVMVADGGTVRFLSPPVPTAVQEYYLRMTTAGLGWAGQVPGGGGATGVEGDGVSDRAARWTGPSMIGTSILKITTGTVEALGKFLVRVKGGESDPSIFTVDLSAAATPLASISMAAEALPEYTAAIDVADRILLWSKTAALTRASPSYLREWLDLYTKGQIDTFLTSYLPLTAGTSKPLSGNLYQTLAAVSANFIQMSQTGVSTGIANSNGNFVLWQGDRTGAYVRNGLEYYTADGSFRVWQFSGGLWQSLTVATQAWVGNYYSELGHTHNYGSIRMDSGFLLGRTDANTGAVQQISVEGLTLSGGKLTNSALVSYVALAGPGETLTTSGAVTSVGTLSWDWQTQVPNVVFAGPSSGAAAAKPTFRPIAKADIFNTALGNSSTTDGTLFLSADRTWKAPPTGGSGGISDVGSAGIYARKIGAWERIDGAAGRIPQWLLVGGVMTLRDTVLIQTGETVASDGHLYAVKNVVAGNYLAAPNLDISTVMVYRTTAGSTATAIIPKLPADATDGKYWAMRGKGTAVASDYWDWVSFYRFPDPPSMNDGKPYVLVNGLWVELTGTGTMVVT